ncbi:hypothetical protein SBA4_150005 [Candidatus Sulfopaludibacter sp. SbA4]|nr:hypothetical protein SBA4_150005 [Candidatus Sulfopaludibacter sp. SbA4]
MVPVRDHRRDVQARLQHDRHLVPRLVHLTAVNALDGEHVEDHGAPVDGHLFGGNPQHGDAGAVAHVGNHVAEGGGAAGHFEPDVETFRHAQFFLHVPQPGPGHVHRARDPHLARQFQAVRVHVGDHREARPGVPHHRRGHDADRPGAGDQHVLAQHRKGKRGVHGVAERVENGGHVQRNRFVVMPHVGHRQRDVFGERTRPVDPDPHGVGAQVAASRQAVAAAPAHHVPLAADDFAGEEIRHVRTDLHDLADEFVADRHGHRDRLLRPIVPLVNVHIGAADPRPQHLNQHVVDPHRGHVHVFEPQAGLAPALHQRLHIHYDNLRIEAVPNLLLFAATTGYQIRVFADAARRLGMDLTLATNRCHVLDDPWGDRAVAVKFDRVPESLEGLRGLHVDGVAAVGDQPAVLACRSIRRPPRAPARISTSRGNSTGRRACGCPNSSAPRSPKIRTRWPPARAIRACSSRWGSRAAAA